jgi:hypothetical protein
MNKSSPGPLGVNDSVTALVRGSLIDVSRLAGNAGPLGSTAIIDAARDVARSVAGASVDEAARIIKIFVNCGVLPIDAVRLAGLLLKGDFESFMIFLDGSTFADCIDCMCALLHGGEPGKPVGDGLIRFVARRFVGRKGPLALANLDHYLAGSGSDFVEPIAEIVEKDAGVRKVLIAFIEEIGLNQPPGRPLFENLRGDLQILQTDYAIQDYRYALGNVDHLFWEVLDTPAARARNASQPGKALTRIRLHDRYEWHPFERRASQCIHLAMENAKLTGAKDFLEVGEAEVFLELSPPFIPVDPKPAPRKP